jgi:hypothetical protein
MVDLRLTYGKNKLEFFRQNDNTNQDYGSQTNNVEYQRVYERIPRIAWRY